jgi:DNA-binding CsgD family transcriptional regulator
VAWDTGVGEETMDRLDGINGFCEAIERAPDLPALFSTLETELAQLGVERFTYAIGNRRDGSRDGFFSTTYPAGWVERYLEQRHEADDVIVHRLAQTLRPFSWREVLTNPHVTLAQKAVVDEATEFSLLSGAAAPICGPGLMRARLVVASSMSPNEFEKMFAQARDLLNLIALYTHERALELVDEPTLEGRVALTARETEALKWTSRGKTSWEISEILSLSEATVKEHLKTACAKFDVRTKAHATALAIWGGYIAA